MGKAVLERDDSSGSVDEGQGEVSREERVVGAGVGGRDCERRAGCRQLWGGDQESDQGLWREEQPEPRAHRRWTSRAQVPQG